MADASELKAAEERGFARGLRTGRLEGDTCPEIPAVGDWLPGVRLAFYRTWFLSFVRQWRGLLANLREVQRVRWLLEHEPGAVPAAARPFVEELRGLEEEYRSGVWFNRFSAEELVDEGCGRACVVAALTAPPQRPATADEYDDLERFLDGDARRRGRSPSATMIFPDVTYGSRWQLENPFRRWETTTWAIGWLCGPFKESREVLADDPVWAEEQAEEDAKATHEIYAIESLDPSDPGAGTGRLWLLGKIEKRAAAEEALREMSREAMADRNSLVAAADAVATAQRKELAALPPDRRSL